MNNNRMKISWTVSLVVLMGIASFAFGDPVTITTNDGTGADTYIYDSGTMNRGYLSSVHSAYYSNGATKSRKMYLRFDLSNAPTVITSAKLKLKASADDATAQSMNYKLYGLNDGTTGETTWVDGTSDWSGSRLVWSSAPGNDNNSMTGMDSTCTTLLQNVSLNITAGSAVEIVLGATGLAFLNADSDNVATLMLVRQSDWWENSKFYSKEGAASAADMPTLELVPEPATMTLLLLGLPFALRRRR